MCGVGGTEFVLIILVVLVVSGPKDLPRMLRSVGQWAGRLRRMAADLRAQSGIDDALRSEGLADDINEIRKLARGELDGVVRAARIDEPLMGGAPAAAAYVAPGLTAAAASYRDGFAVAREREYPRDGADAYGTLPDDSIVYVEALPKSVLARDALYVLGDADAELPPEPEATAEPPSDEPTPADEAEPEAAEAPATPRPAPATEGH